MEVIFGMLQVTWNLAVLLVCCSHINCWSRFVEMGNPYSLHAIGMFSFFVQWRGEAMVSTSNSTQIISAFVLFYRFSKLWSCTAWDCFLFLILQLLLPKKKKKKILQLLKALKLLCPSPPVWINVIDTVPVHILVLKHKSFVPV